ncbi:MAG TPA: 50S ribosomal protein L18e [Thermoplasmata archaeon]|jgi:large subunit ribosomal protein L18e|nr:50S ribosomal protein L18e [Thermoplasmata archaeon]
MPAPFRQKNPELHHVVVALRKAARAHDAAIWGSVADRLERPRHQHPPVNVGHLDRLADADEWVVVPGKLLADGTLSKALTVAAAGYSGEARTKIHAAGGTALSIPEILQARPDGAGVRILG